jgi:hypothetical protein
MILALGKEAGMNDLDLILYQGHCFNHLRNTWFEGIENYLSRKITDHLKNDLEIIPSHLQVSCKISDLLCQVVKQYSFTANYFKGSSDDYADCKEGYPPSRCGASQCGAKSNIFNPSLGLKNLFITLNLEEPGQGGQPT